MIKECGRGGKEEDRWMRFTGEVGAELGWTSERLTPGGKAHFTQFNSPNSPTQAEVIRADGSVGAEG